MEVLISIIVPIYNVKEKYLRKCIESIINQEFRSFELILINDGSTNNSLEICKQYEKEDQRVIVINKVNGGVSESRNCGLECAKGDYISFVDSDDYVEINFIKELYEKIIESKSDLVISSFKKQYNNKIVENDFLENNKDKMLNIDCIGTVWGKLYKKEIISGNLFNIGIKYAEDIEFNFRVFRNVKKYAYINNHGYVYRQLPDSTVRTFNPSMIFEYEKTINAVRDNLDWNIDIYMDMYYVFVCTIYRVIVENYIFSNENLKTLKKKLEFCVKFSDDRNYKEAIKKVKLKFFRFTRALPIFCAKKRLYFFLYIIIMFRKNQIKIYQRGENKND